MVVVEANSLVKRFGAYTALHEMSFRVRGDTIAVLGPNGSGKTTLLSIIAGLRKPSSGSLRVEETEPYRARSKAFSNFSFMFERPKLPLNIRVKDVVEIIGSCDYTEFFYRELGFGRILDRKLYALSMGEAQLVGLYVSICRKSTVVILDEPFAHLDVRRASLLQDLVWSLRRERSIVFTTHTPEEAEAIGDSIIILEDGFLKWSGRVEELVRRDVYEILVRPVNKNKLVEELRRANASIVACFGSYCFVSGVSSSLLGGLVDKGVILGYRAVGVRGYYAGIES